MRIIGLVICLLLSIGIVAAQSAIVLISPSAAGPSVREETYSHPLWVTWPVPLEGDGVNQLVSIVCQAEPSVGQAHFQFYAESRNRFRNRALASLRKFKLPQRTPSLGSEYVALQIANRGIDRGVLSMCGATSESVLVTDSISPGSDMVYCLKASSWDEVAKISRQIPLRTLAIEFPPTFPHRWSRTWVYEHGSWMKDKAVGVVESTDLVRFFVDARANDFVQNPGASPRSGPPDRWLSAGELAKGIKTSFFVLVWVATFLTLGFLSQDRSSLSSRIPFYVVMGALLAYRYLPLLLPTTGVQMWGLWLSLGTAAFVGAFVAVDLQTAKGSREAMAWVALPAFCVSLLLNPASSPFGFVYSLPRGYEHEQLGIDLMLCGYFFTAMKNRSGFVLLLSMLVLPLGIWHAIARPYGWSLGFEAAYYLDLLLFLIPGKASRIAAVILAFYLSIEIPLSAGQIVWRPYETALDQRYVVNYHDLVVQLFRPEVFIGILAIVSAAVFSSKYEFHLLKKGWKKVPTVRTSFIICGLILVWSIGNPGLIGALPWALAFAYLFWSQEALANV